MSDVPSDICRDILLRLPAESLFRFRAVRRSWRTIIDDQSFVQSHTTNNHRLFPNLLIRNSTGTFYSFPLDCLNFVNGQQTIQATHVKNLIRLGVPRIRSLPVASCNGLILISHDGANKTWAIWNPLTGDFHELHQPDDDFKSSLVGVGIGYDSRSDDYKVVRIVMVHNTGKQGVVYQTSIYSVKSKSWRIINCPSNVVLRLWSYEYGVFLNGALHWSSEGMVVALDLVTEEYRELQSPPVESRNFPMRLYALDGCLVLCDDNSMRRAWVLRGEGWVELFSTMERSVISGLKWGCLWPLAYSNSKRQFIMQHDNRIVRWDIGEFSCKRVTIGGLDPVPGYHVTSQVIGGSLFRLNGGGGGSTAVAGVKRKRSKPSARVQFTAITIDSGCVADPVPVPLADPLDED